VFLFTHIEKCAGTSLNDVLSLTFLRYFHVTVNNYGGNELRNDLDLNQFNKIKKYKPSGIGGHSVRPYLEYFNTDVKKITFLRNPIDRYLSHLNHIIETGWAKSIDDFLSKEQFKDFMTKKIAGENEYDKAFDILSNFNFVGDANQYAKSLNYLQDVLQVRLIGNDVNKNQRSSNTNYIKYSDLSNEQKNKVEENNKNDIKLYKKLIINNSIINTYNDVFLYKKPSLVREKLVLKLNKYKKKKIVEPIRKLKT